MITYEELVCATLKYNCLPAVVPELKTITVGGAFVGLGIESSSFRYGLVHENKFGDRDHNRYRKRCALWSNNEYRDLFYAFPNSYGTLGYVLRVKMKLIPAKRLIQLTNFKFTNAQLYFREVESALPETSQCRLLY